MTELLSLVIGFLRSFVRRDTELLVENLALRHQLQVVVRSNPRPRLRNRDRILWIWMRRFCPGSWKRHLVVMKPETVIGRLTPHFRGSQSDGQVTAAIDDRTDPMRD